MIFEVFGLRLVAQFARGFHKAFPVRVRTRLSAGSHFSDICFWQELGYNLRKIEDSCYKDTIV